MLTIVDYGMGNLRSVANAFEAIGVPCRVEDHPDALRAADRVVLPGVGAFGEAMARLRERGWVEALRTRVLVERTPFLGICLGMQLLADRSSEHGDHQGLGWIAGDVRLIQPSDRKLRVPHIGWNGVTARPTLLFNDVPPETAFYFVHSYHFVPTDPAVVAATTDYGGPLVAAIAHEHIFATQFHPEKSHHAGLALLKSFMRYAPC